MDWALLRDLPETDKRRVLSAARLKRFSRNEVIYHEGDPGDTLHLISKGRVAIRVTTPLGSVATLAVLGAGDFFGEQALLGSDARRTATVTALEKTETMALLRDDFETLQTDHPAVLRFLVIILAAQVRRLSGQVLDALYTSADDRVLRQLVHLADIYGGRKTGTAIPLTQDDLATMAGTSRATVNRVLSEAEQAGILAVGRMKIEILDPDKLAQRAR